jgi:ATP-dependent Clp protease, protease subunit
MSKSAEILIYDIIGRDFWSGEGVTASDFRKSFKALEDNSEVESIDIRINSPGGSVFDGIAIYNVIKQSKKPVNTYVDGIAYSMAGIIALAGNKVYASKNATILIHNCLGGARGNARDLRQTIEMMDKIDNSLAESLAAKTGLKVKDIMAKWLNYDDHTLSADEAKAEKLIDEVTELTAEIPKDLINLRGDELFAAFSKLNSEKDKEGLFNKIAARVAAMIGSKSPEVVNEPITTDIQNSINKSLSDMKMKISTGLTALVALLAFTAGADEKELEVEITAEHLDKINNRFVELENSLKTEQDAKVAIQAKLDEATAKLAEFKAETVIVPAASSEKGPDANAQEEVSYETDLDRQMKAFRGI